MRKINVLQAANGLGIGGIEKTLQLYSEYLDKEIFNITICGLYKGGVRGDLLRGQGFEVTTVNGSKNDLVKLMREKQIDILHLHPHGLTDPLAIEAAREAKVPAIVETNIYAEIADNAVNKYIDLHLVIGKWCAMRCKKWLDLSWDEFFEKCHVLYNPIAIADFDGSRVMNISKQELYQKYNIPPNYYVIGRHARPVPEKWPDLCIAFLPHLLKIVPNVKYLVMGFPEERIHQIKRMGLEDHFIFFPPTADFEQINEFLYLLDVFPIASVHGESFGNVIAEAMTWKIPVVSNSLPHRYNAQVELIDHGKTGFIANNPKTFAQAIAYLLMNPQKKEKMGLAARMKVENNYEVKMNTARLEQFYINLLIKKGVSIDPAIRDLHADAKSRPSHDEIIDFEKEYSQRIRSCWGRPNYLEIYLWEKFLCSYGIYRLTKNIRNIIDKLK